MANFQTQVNIAPGAGIPGAYASVNPIVSTPLGRLASVNCPIGGFVWDDSANEGCVKPAGSGAPLGFVVHNKAYTYDLTNIGNFVPAGDSVNVQVEGDFYVTAPAAVTKGGTVYALTASGAISATATNAVDTGFKFATSATAAGEIVIISKH